MQSYEKINKQINDYLQALTSNKSIFENVERKRVRIAEKLLTPKNKTLLDIEYEKLQEEANTFNSIITGEKEKYSINEQLMDVIKYIGDNLSKQVKELGVDGTQMDVQKVTMESQQQIEQLRNDVAVFVKGMEDFKSIKELPLGSANSIIPESNAGFINYVSNRNNKGILLAPLPDNSGFNLVVLDEDGKINKETGVIPLSEFSKAMAAGELLGYFEQVPDSQTLDMFYKDMDQLVESLIKTDADLKKQTGKGLFNQKAKETKVPRKVPVLEPITEKEARKFFNNNPQGKQMLYSFLENESLLGYYKNMQYSDYIDKNKPFTTDNYLKAIENYLVSKFNRPVPVPQENQEAENPVA